MKTSPSEDAVHYGRLYPATCCGVGHPGYGRSEDYVLQEWRNGREMHVHAPLYLSSAAEKARQGSCQHQLLAAVGKARMRERRFTLASEWSQTSESAPPTTSHCDNRAEASC